MKKHVLHAVSDTLNSSEDHICYTDWFSKPDFLSI